MKKSKTSIFSILSVLSLFFLVNITAKAFYITNAANNVSARFSLNQKQIKLTIEGSTPVINFLNANNQLGHLQNVAIPTNNNDVANKIYVDNQVTATLNASKKYTDDQVTATLNASKKYTDDQVTASKKYTDDQVTATYQIVANVLAPIGSIIAWYKRSNVPLPIGFVEVNGQTINDAQSAFNGVRLPNLNGEKAALVSTNVQGDIGKFVGSNSVTLQPSQMPAHNHAFQWDVTTRWSTRTKGLGTFVTNSGLTIDGDLDVSSGSIDWSLITKQHTTSNAGSGSAIDIRQKSLQIVFIMRIK